MNITLDLPDELVQDALEFGVLDKQVVAALLQQEVDRRVMDMVNSEIEAYRREKASGNPGAPQHSE